jgi:hypothetical protein
MPSVDVTMPSSATDIINVPITDGLPSRVVITMISGTASAVWVTGDTSAPIQPVPGVEIPNQKELPAVLGSTVSVYPNLFQAPVAGGLSPSGMQLPLIRLASAGSPVIRVSW